MADRPFTPAGAILLFLVHYATQLAVLLLGGALSAGDSVDLIFLVAAAVVAPLVALYVGLVRYAPTEPTLAALRLHRPAGREWRRLALAVVCGAALAPLVVAVYHWVVTLVPVRPEDPEVQDQLRVAQQQVGVWVLSALAPFGDDALFRGFVQPRLIPTMGARRAVWLTVLAAVFVRLTALDMPVALLEAVPLGLIALASRTLWVVLAARVGIEAVLLTLPDTAMPPWVVAGCALAAGAALYGVWRLRVKEP